MRGNIFSQSAVRKWSERLEGALDVHTIMGFQRPMDRYVEVPGQTRANGAVQDVQVGGTDKMGRRACPRALV